MCGGSSFHPRRFLAGVPRSTSSGSVNLRIHRLRRTFSSVFGCGCGSGWWSIIAAPLYRYLYVLRFLLAAPSAVNVVPCAVPGAFGGALFERISGDTKNPRFRRTGDRWCARRDSNPQPSDPYSDALSVELQAHVPRFGFLQPVAATGTTIRMSLDVCKPKNLKFTQNPLRGDRKHPVLPHDSGVFALAKFFQNIFAPAQNLP